MILDGFPRTLRRPPPSTRCWRRRSSKLDAVIELKVDDNQLIERIVGRFTCAKCGEGYHDRFKRPKVRGVCDVCESTEFTRRPDDTAETVNKRLMVYYRETSPLIGYYFCKGNLRTVDGMAPIDQVAKEIGEVLDADQMRNDMGPKLADHWRWLTMVAGLAKRQPLSRLKTQRSGPARAAPGPVSCAFSMVWPAARRRAVLARGRRRRCSGDQMWPALQA